jgi:hypothetical protein
MTSDVAGSHLFESLSGPCRWLRYLTSFPRAGAAITHQLIVSGFAQCMSIKDDSTATFTKYIARLNESLVPGLITTKDANPLGWRAHGRNARGRTDHEDMLVDWSTIYFE